MNSDKVFNFIERNMGWIIVAQFIAGTVCFSIGAYVVYRVLHHFGIL